MHTDFHFCHDYFMLLPNWLETALFVLLWLDIPHDNATTGSPIY